MDNQLPENDPLVIKLSNWFNENDKDNNCLLPQNLSESLLEEMCKQAKVCLGQQGDAPAPLVAVGLIVSKGKPSFEATREQLSVFVKAYSFNVVVENLRRNKLISFSTEFNTDNVLDMSFERGFELTELGRQAASQAGSELNTLFKAH